VWRDSRWARRRRTNFAQIDVDRPNRRFIPTRIEKIAPPLSTFA